MKQMSKYFKVLKGEITGKKFTAVVAKMQEAFDAQKAFCEKYGFTEWRPSRWHVRGGIEGCRSPLPTADLTYWRINKEDDYVPKMRTKQGKEIRKEMDDLPIVDNTDLGEIVNDDQIFRRIGFSIPDGEYYLFVTTDDVTPPEDCIEITFTEHKNLQNEK